MGFLREFHMSRQARNRYGIRDSLFSSRGTMVFTDLSAARECLHNINSKDTLDDLRAEDLFAMGLIDEAFHIVLYRYKTDCAFDAFAEAKNLLIEELGEANFMDVLQKFLSAYPTTEIFRGETPAERYLSSIRDGESGSAVALEELLMLHLARENQGFSKGQVLLDSGKEMETKHYRVCISGLKTAFKLGPVFGPEDVDVYSMLRKPAELFPQSLQQQLEYIRDHWGYLLGDMFLRLLRGIDFLQEVNAFLFRGHGDFTVGPMDALEFSGLEEYEHFSADADWMPKVVLLAKSCLVWLHQLSVQYERSITRLDEIPDRELDIIASRGFNSLWLIGIWQRSDASRTIKQMCGNEDAAASAYSLYDMQICSDIGGWAALEELKKRCAYRGIRLTADMVPNHTGIDSKWVHQYPERYLQLDAPPYSTYRFERQNLSSDPNIGIFLEDHYYDQSDASVVFKRVDFRNGKESYIYHGNDGTHMPWNDTAQLNYLDAEVREAVIQEILQVARHFPIIRFDAAMTLAKKHIHRLWFPEPGSGGDIPSRAEHGLSWADFNRLMPKEFWREVVDRVAVEAPDTLLLAEAFWMMEGYFVRTLGMHRVYNSAFMNMLKNEENAKYRQTIRNTIEFDKDILKRFVNFMNNPDEDTAIAQFGDGDKYFGVCTLMVTMPGLPMFGHGQIEGFREKYGMEYRRSYMNEQAQHWFVERHEREVFPLLKMRDLFSNVENFYFYDFYADSNINENVFVYSNGTRRQKAIVAYNNNYERTKGYVLQSCGFAEKTPGGTKTTRSTSIAQALGVNNDEEYWVLLRESHSNLWFLRNAAVLHTQGLFISLEGYQAQVFVDVHQVRDNIFGHYRRLAEGLAGRGIADIQRGLRSIVLEPVFQALRRAFTPEFVDKFVEFLSSTGTKDVADRKFFVNQFKIFLEAVEKQCEDPQLINRSLRIYTQAINNISQLRTLEPKSRSKIQLDSIYEAGDRPDAIRMCAFVFLMSLGSHSQQWFLETELNDMLGMRLELATTLRWVESYSSWVSDAKQSNVPHLAYALNQQAVLDAIGANYFDEKFWFKKEQFLDFCRWTAVVQVLFADHVDEKLVENLRERLNTWQKLMEKSQYQIEKLRKLSLKGRKTHTRKRKSANEVKTGSPKD